ncbi:MAG: cellulase family glycosylhydrolase [Oscillospiraceae bacterium]|nr:cellulase family glycosylhydrolase [Oscillospiraceae bacterium]
MKDMIGCNYWASHAGPEMWADWNEEVVRKDLGKLAEQSLDTLRVFPNWRDFQPLTPHRGQKGSKLGYIEKKQNSYYLDEMMLTRFGIFLDLCHAQGLRCIVGLLTGWMSGRLFAPTALLDKNLFTDPTALLFQQRFVTGMVTRFKDHPAVYAWDLGNECNCLSECADRDTAANWTSLIANAIRAADPTKPVVSGMHGLTADGIWTIADQGEACDLLTTHPYPRWCAHTYHDATLSLRTTMHATCETKLYADLSGKPCMMEEIGTMGPMICSDEAAADFIRLNLFSGWANGSRGLLWWCANEQTDLRTSPFFENMIERELGLFYADGREKPVVEELRRFSAFLKTAPSLPKAKEDAVCILTKDQDQWGAAYMTWCLAKQAGLTLRFCWCEDELPESDLYLMPSVSGLNSLPLDRYEQLQEKVRNGATLYISNDDGIFSGFEALCGLKCLDSGLYDDRRTVTVDGVTLPFTRKDRFVFAPTTAQVLYRDSEGDVAVSVNALGKGDVCYVNFPLETMLLPMHEAFDTPYYTLYRKLFGLGEKDPHLALTVHPAEHGEEYRVYVNHSKEVLSVPLPEGATAIYGDPKAIGPYDACVVSCP